MPVYEYRCSACQRIFEYQQRMADPAKTTCEECGGALERLISRSNFALKGSGWYKDLYSSAKPEAAATPEGGAAAATPAATPAASPAPASGGDGGTAAKPATPAPSAPSTGSGTGTGTGTGSGSGGTT